MAIKRKLVIEVNVGDQRDANLFLDFAQLFRRFAHRHGAANDLAAGRLQIPDLLHRGAHVARIGLGHRLDGDRRIAADLDLAELNLSGFDGVESRGHYRERLAAGQQSLSDAQRISGLASQLRRHHPSSVGARSGLRLCRPSLRLWRRCFSCRRDSSSLFRRSPSGMISKRR